MTHQQTAVNPGQIDEQKLQGFLHQIAADLAACSAGFMTNLGYKLGLYRAMAGAGPMTSQQLAARTGCHERYTREWLNSQAAGGYVEYLPVTQQYFLPPEQALVLADENGPCFFPPALEVSASMWFDEEKILHAFKSGAGIPWSDHNGRLFCGVAAFFRSGYAANLVQHWLPSLEGVCEKLQQGGRVADIGCGHGHSTLIMAKSFPLAKFYGFDTHAESIATARANAAAAGLADRVEFHVTSGKNVPDLQFDLVCFFDCLHDLGDPIGAARQARQVLAADGVVMLVEPFAGDKVEENLNTVGRIYYSGSTALCCAHSLSEEVGMALGAQAGEQRLAAVLREAGFSRVRRATETPFNIILEARC